ncbi:PBECR2 nuclease fold domain-containing protein [Salipaludibacillus sp. CF4.18]|uniref:PBECR3 domain-containing polyvalent protein n=1 Tax=Salipaludibacillus sp. CF4.18 TaxID=3373081 RepID=UPI003EE665B2
MRTIDLETIDKVTHIGKAKKECFEILGIPYRNVNIILWRDRLKYIEKHKKDFSSEEEWRFHCEFIPEIIMNPDYFGLHPDGKSIQFIKKIDRDMICGVKTSDEGDWIFRTSYPIKQKKLQNYLESGRIKSVEEHRNLKLAYANTE